MEEGYTLHLGSIPGNLTREELLAELSKIARIDKLDLKTKSSGESLNSGFAWLRVSSEADKSRLLKTPVVIRGRTLKVSPEYQGEELERYQDQYRRRTVYLKNLPPECTDLQLTQLFAQHFGLVEKAFRIVHQSTQTKKSYGNVVFVHEADASAAISAKYLDFGGSRIEIFEYKKQPTKETLQMLQALFNVYFSVTRSQQTNSSGELILAEGARGRNDSAQSTRQSNNTTTIYNKSHHNFACHEFELLARNSFFSGQSASYPKISALSTDLRRQSKQHSDKPDTRHSNRAGRLSCELGILKPKANNIYKSKLEALSQCPKIEQSHISTNLVFRKR